MEFDGDDIDSQTLMSRFLLIPAKNEIILPMNDFRKAKVVIAKLKEAFLGILLNCKN